MGKVFTCETCKETFSKALRLRKHKAVGCSSKELKLIIEDLSPQNLTSLQNLTSPQNSVSLEVETDLAVKSIIPVDTLVDTIEVMDSPPGENTILIQTFAVVSTSYQKLLKNSLSFNLIFRFH